jgi:hypothetical protein
MEIPKRAIFIGEEGFVCKLKYRHKIGLAAFYARMKHLFHHKDMIGF